MSYQGRPDFIPREEFRKYASPYRLSRLFRCGSHHPPWFIEARRKECRPIRSRRRLGQTVYRPLDVVAAARADFLQVRPAAIDEVTETLKSLQRQVRALQTAKDSLDSHRPHALIQLNEISIGLSAHRLLLAHEIVEQSVKYAQMRQTGVYFLIIDFKVVYVGQSNDVLRRVSEHQKQKEFDAVAHIFCEPHQLDVLESLYIHALAPPLNWRSESGSLRAPLSFQSLLDLRMTEIFRPKC